jgi:hypothetical protein
VRNASFVSAVALTLASGAARADGIDGTVERVDSHWSAAGDRIVTELTIRDDAGAELTAWMLGGTAGGIGMWSSHAPPVPRVGDRIRASVRATSDASGAPAWQLDGIAAIAPAPPGGGSTLGFVNTRTRKSETPLRWASGCIFLAFHPAGTSHLPNETEIMNDVLARWRDAVEACSYLEFRVDGTADVEVGYDGTNLIRFREDRWCRPATADEPEMCYSPAAAALTTLFFVDDPGNGRDAEIVDADIEMNGVHFAISDDGATSGTAGCHADLANTLTHEVGHLMGLDHTCWDGIPPRPVDDQGDDVPSCSPEAALSQEVRDATMYNFQVCGETKKATPEPDDIAGICAVYALANDPGTCSRVEVDDGGGCWGCAATGDSAARGSIALGLIALVALRRRRAGARRHAGSR